MLKFVAIAFFVFCVVKSQDDDEKMKTFFNCWKKEMITEIAICANETKKSDDDAVCMHKAMACFMRKHDALTPAPEDNMVPEKHQKFIQEMAANEKVSSKLCEAAKACYVSLELEAFSLCFMEKLSAICAKPSE